MDRRRWAARIPAAVTSAVCVAAIVAGLLLATGAATPAVALAASGHWVVNAAENTVVHVDGGTAQVDAKVELREDIGEPLLAVQGEQQGFVVGRERIAVFGRSTLTVDTSIPVGFDEVPVGIETVGGPYLVYRTAGTIVRLGLPPLTLPVGGPVARPVWTDDGTGWLQRTDDGSFCAVRAGADVLDCAAGVAAGEPGGLSITGTVPAFVGTRRDAAQVVAASLGAPVGLGADVAEAGLLADRDTEGRLAVVEPGVNRLVLADSAGVPDGRAGGAAVTVDLGPGEFTSPVASGGVVAVLDTATNRLLTFDVDGTPLGTAQLPPGDAPTLTRGADGRIYVDDAGGASTHVVAPDGGVTSVATGGRLPDTVAIAAPPERSSPVVPPSGGADLRFPNPGRGVPRNGAELPTDRPIDGPGGQQQRRIEDPPTDPPDLLPPASVTARAVAGGGVSVEWPAVDGAQSYVVRGGGRTVDAAGTTAGFDGLPVGRPVTFTVQSVNATGRSAESAPSAPATPYGTPGAPTGFRATPSCDENCEAANLTWQQPDLAGGRLVHYRVTGAQDGREMRTQTVTTPSARYDFDDDYSACGVIVFAVQAVTTAPGSNGDEQEFGPEAVYTFGGYTDAECVPSAYISNARAEGTTMFVTVFEYGTGTGVCTIEIDGVGRSSQECGRDPLLPGFAETAEVRDHGARIDGLDPETTYSVTVTASNENGSTTSDAVLVTTGAG